MHVLMFGLDYTIFTNEGRGDLADRLRQYAKFVDFISLVVYTPDRNFKPIEVADNIVVYPSNSASKLRFPFDAVSVANDIHKERPVSVVTSQDPFACGFAGYLFKRKFKVPFVVNIVSSFFDDPFWKRESFVNPFLNKFGKWLVRRADGVRVECETEREKIISLGVPESKVRVAPVLVDLKKFVSEKGSVRDKFIDGFDKIVLFIGRLSVEKNIGLLIKSAKIVAKQRPKTLFLIVGGGKDELSLKSLARGCENIVFVGRVPHSEISKFYKSVDLFVLPSLYEGVPLVIVEASASGLPVVCTDVRDAKDVIIDEVSGFIVPKDNADVMALRILDVLNDSALAKSMGLAGQKLVLEKFDTEKNIKQCIELWESVVK